ncbi:MAG: hypothetical protein JWN73_1061 [Betaproteobacteria bacterium]|nr:hypothetical protein [Betaproteobacteria bacterium]
MLYDSHSHQADTTHTDWLPSGTGRRSAYRIFVVCLSTSAPRVEQLVIQNLKAKGAGVRGKVGTALPSKDGSRTRIVFTVHGESHVRGAISELINLLAADTCVRTVRWESDPQGA